MTILDGKQLTFTLLFSFSLLLGLTFGDHMFKCGDTKACYSATEVCLKGECVPTCVDDKDCPDGHTCHATYKVRSIILIMKWKKKSICFQYCMHGCRSDQDCLQGLKCHNSKCLQACQNHRNCPSTDYCHIDHKVCHNFCIADQTCSRGYKCSSGQCLKPCRSTPNCNANQYCDE